MPACVIPASSHPALSQDMLTDPHLDPIFPSPREKLGNPSDLQLLQKTFDRMK